MNRRERILALTVLTVVILVAGGLLFKFLFFDPWSVLRTQIADAEQDLTKKQAEKEKEQQDESAIKHRDPRLGQWKVLSLPEDKNQEEQLKNGRSLEEEKKRHDDHVQVEYEKFLSDLVMRSGFAPNSIKVSSAPPDRKGAPILTGKTPIYTRLSFMVQGQASLDAVVRMLEDFHRTPLLHEVRNLTLTSKQPARNGGQANAPAPGAAPGGFPGAAPGGFPGAAPGGFPGAAPGGFPGGPPGGFPGGFARGPGGNSGGGDLDVNLTVEALLVTGAEKRDALLPDNAVKPPQVLADPARQYADILTKNMFTGVTAASKLTEDRAQVLGVVKLTSIWNGGRRWEATIYDQGKGGDEKRLKPPVLDEFSVADKYGNELVKGKALQLDEDGLVFQANDKTYRWRCGEFLGPVLDNPMKADEIKKLGLPPATASASPGAGDKTAP